MPERLQGYSGVSISTVYEWAKRGEIPAYRVDGTVIFEEREILEWIKARRFGPKRKSS